MLLKLLGTVALAVACVFALSGCGHGCSLGDPLELDPTARCDNGPDEDPTGRTVTVKVQDLGAYQGRELVLRILDSSGFHGQRADVASIAGSDVSETFYSLGTTDTQVIAWIDANGNGTCEPPPADAAWRVALPSGDGTVTITSATAQSAQCP